eukprot:Ihof_evm20s43 gene=Ihof_evmTU20s43
MVEIKTVEAQALETEELLLALKGRIAALQQLISCATTGQAPPGEDEICSKLEKENDALKVNIAGLKATLQEVNTKNGYRAFMSKEGQVIMGEDASKVPQPAAQAAAPKKAKKEKAPKQPAASTAAAAAAIDVSRLDMRVGYISEVTMHPDADTLFVETIDVGEEKPRTILSGLVADYSLEQMKNRQVVILCNLKPAKMRGIFSEGMVMCAIQTNAEGRACAEIIDPPAGSKPGDRVTFAKYP